MLNRLLVTFAFVTALAVPAACSALHAVEWNFTDREWVEGHSEHAAPTFTRDANHLVVSARRDRAIRFERPLAMDGDDSEPLIISCALSAQGDRALAQAPMGFSVVWPDAEVFVGLAVDRDMKGVARWRLSGETAGASDDAKLDPASFLNYVRIVVTRRVVECAVSGDGTTWRRIHQLERNGPLSGAPMRLVLGAGWGGAQNLDRSTDQDTKAPTEESAICMYRFTQLSVARWSAQVPASLLATYSRGESREATVDALMAESFPRTWWIAGPFPTRSGTYGPEEEPFDPSKPAVSGDDSAEWEEVTVGDELHQRLIVLDRRTKNRKGRSAFFATTVIDSSAARRVRFLYDGYHSVALFVNGKPLSVDRHARSGSGTAELDRLSAFVDLQAGRNVVTLRLLTSDRGGCAFVFRTEPGDPRYRIALERRLALDFAHDVEEVAAGLFEAARIWEELGHVVAAVNVLNELIANDDMSVAVHERALLERTRLHAHVRDQEQVDQDVAAVRAFWSDHAGVDRATVMRRAAELWSRLGQSDRASTELTQAIQVEGLSRDRRFDLLLEQVRLQIQSDATEEDLSALVAEAVTHFPADDRLRAYVASTNADGAAAKKLLSVRDPVVLRLVAGIARASADPKTLTAALRTLVDLEPAGLADDPAVTLAEHVATTGDQAGAVEAYRLALSRHGLDGKVTSLDQARVAYLDGRLRQVPGVSELLAQQEQVDASISAEMPITDWQVIGPFPNPDWAAYKKLPIDPAKTRGQGKEGGKEWQASTPAHYENDVLQFKRLYDIDNHVVVCYRVITSPSDIRAELSFGADDGVIVWLNGKKLHEDREQRGVSRDSLNVDLPLKKGDNRLVVLVQNGNGDWGLQARVLIPTLSDMQLSSALRAAVAMRGDRKTVAATLADACQAGLRFGRGDLVAEICPVVLAAFPDQGDALVPLARRFLDGTTARHHPDAAIAALQWWDARDRMDFTTGDDRPRLGGQRQAAGQILLELGALTEAGDLLEWIPLSSTSAGVFTIAMRQFGDIRLLLGDISSAQRWFERTVAVRGGDNGAHKRAREALAGIRRIRIGVRPVTASLDATTAAQSAERAAAANDIEHAEQAFQQALSLGASEILPTTEGRFMGIAWWSIQRLRALPAAAQGTYAQRFGRLAEQTLAAALARDDVDAIERVAARWPIAPAAATALIEAAQRYRAAGADSLAAATAQLAAERFQLSSDQAAVVAALQTTPSSPAIPRVEAVVGSIPITLSPTALHDLKRFVGEGERPVHVPLLPAAGDGLAALHSGVEVVAYDVASGQERWRQWATAVGRPGQPAHFGQRLHGAVISDGVVVGLSVAGAVPLIEARDALDGSLRWATFQRAELGDFIPIASPSTDGSRVLVLGVEGERGVLCALRPRDGALLWRTTLPVALAALVITDETNIEFGRHQGPPVVVGREIFVTLDSGALISVDAPTGVVRWVATYPRGVFHSDGSRRVLATLLDRSPGAIAVGTDTVVVLPRDRSGAFAFARADGASRWTLDHSDARVLSGAYRSGDQEFILLGGATVQAIDTADGMVRWTWRSNDGAVCGTPSVIGDTVYVSTARALHVLGLADGQPSTPPTSWSALGYAGSTPGQFVAHAGRLLVASAAGMVVLGPGKPPAKPAVLIPALRRSGGPQPAVPATADAAGVLGIAWRLPGEHFVGVIDAEDPRPDEMFLRLKNGLVRMSRDLRIVHWHLRLPATVRGIAVHGDQVVVLTDATMVAYHRDHASVRWAVSVASNPALVPSDPWRMRVGIGPRTVVAYGHEQSWLMVRQARTGALVWRGSLSDHRLLWAGEIGEDLVTVAAIGDKRLVIQRRDPAQPNTVRSETSRELEVKHAVVRSVPGRPILVLMGVKSAWLDLAKAEIKPLDTERGWPVAFEVHADGIDIVTRDDKRFNYLVLDPKDGKVRFNSRYHDGSLNESEYHSLRYGRAGDVLIRQDLVKHRRLQLVAVGIDGKERFKRQDEPYDRMHPVTTVGIAGHIHVLSWSNSRLHARRLAADGAVSAEALIPVHVADGPFHYSIVGDLMIMDSDDGVVILRGLKDPKNVVDDAPLAVHALRARLGLSEHPAQVTPELATQPLIDGHLDEWSDDRANRVDGSGIRTLGGEVPPPSLRWWSGYTAVGVVLAAEVGAPTAALSGPGLPPLASPGLLVGIAPLDDGRSEQALVFHLGVADGRTVVRAMRGLDASDSGVQDIQVRASRAGEITRYEMTIPWSLLRRREEDRPGDRKWMRIGLATIAPDQDTAREAGFGLLEGQSNVWWIPTELKKP